MRSVSRPSGRFTGRAGSFGGVGFACGRRRVFADQEIERLLLAKVLPDAVDRAVLPERFLQLVERLVVKSGTTLVVVTHSREWLRLADRLWRVHERRLEEAAGEP